MTKKELRRMIREEVRREINNILPDVIEEAMGEVTRKVKKLLLRETKKVRTREQPAKDEMHLNFDPNRMKELIGYADFEPGRYTYEEGSYTEPEMLEESNQMEIAGIPIEGGLAAREEAMSTGVDFRAMPPALQKSIANAKAVFDDVEKKKNWRPGMKK